MAPPSWFRRLHRAFGLVDDAAEANAAEQHGAQTIRMFLRVLISLDGDFLRCRLPGFGCGDGQFAIKFI